MLRNFALAALALGAWFVLVSAAAEIGLDATVPNTITGNPTVVGRH